MLMPWSLWWGPVITLCLLKWVQSGAKSPQGQRHPGWSWQDFYTFSWTFKEGWTVWTKEKQLFLTLTVNHNFHFRSFTFGSHFKRGASRKLGSHTRISPLRVWEEEGPRWVGRAKGSHPALGPICNQSSEERLLFLPTDYFMLLKYIWFTISC